MEFWEVKMFSVVARLQRNDGEIARNGVLGRYDFSVLAWLRRNDDESHEVR